jgi:hypothetical protein
MEDQNQYIQWHKQQEEQWESRCGRCGACCGAFDGDPCEHLRQDAQRKYYCSIYDHRFGTHKTLSGKEIRCVPIRQILHFSWPGDSCCGYKKSESLIK